MEKLFVGNSVDGLTVIVVLSIILAIVLLGIIAYKIHVRDEAKKEVAAEVRRNLAERLLLTKVDKLILFGSNSWTKRDFFLLSDSWKQVNELGFSRPAILASANVFELFVEVSHIKGQVFFTDSISRALAILDKEFSNSHDDKVIKMLLDNLSGINSVIEKIKGYKGIDALKTLIEKSCPNLLAISNS